MNFKTIAFFAAAAVLSACNDNELDINAPWKETPVVYAVVNAGQDSQIFRIQKTYQNSVNQSTNDVAQIADSLTLKNITVELRDLVTGENRFLKRLAPRKQAGFFSNRDSSYWGENLAGFINPAHAYELVIKSANTGNTYRAVSSVVDTAVIQPQLPSSVVDLANTTQPSIAFSITGGSRNVSYYDMAIRVNYLESPNGNPGAAVMKYIDYTFVTNQQRTGTASAPMERVAKTVVKKGITDYIKNAVKKDASVERTFVSLEYVFTGVNNIYNDMKEVNTPSTSVISKGADFSNISNGIGVFASRTQTSLEYRVSTSTVTMLNNILNQ